MHYRPEIDGLRAIAVVSVILFHAGVDALKGGFVGVDIFFVISGYLITRTVMEERRRGAFTIAGFYERRARRILPALLLVMAACIPFALLWMLPDYLENFGQSLVATLLFGNNFLLLATSGYFSLEAEFKPLLHTWSLGVEEQFYLLFPLAAALAWRQPRPRALVAVGVLLAASLALAHTQFDEHPMRAYYMLHTRAWQLLLGIGVALLAERTRAGADVRPRRVDAAGALAGLAMIAYAVTCFDSDTNTPGLPALVPAAGTALVLHCAGPHNLAGRALGIRWLVGLGLVSYSAYLWHQPLFAFARLRSLEQPGLGVFLALAFVAFVLAYASWRFVEMPARRPASVGRKTFLAGLGLGAAATGGIGLFFHFTAGFVVPQNVLDAESSASGRWTHATYNADPYRFKDRPFTASDARKVLVVGNSFARDFINAGQETGAWAGTELSYADAALTCIAPGAIAPGLRDRIARADYVIYGSPSIDTRCWAGDLRSLKALGAAKVIVIGGKNFGWNMNAVMRLDEAARRRYRAAVPAGEDARNSELARTVGPAHFVDVMGLLMDGQRRVPVVTGEGKLISQDRRHFTRAGARFVGELLFEHPLLRPLKPSR